MPESQKVHGKSVPPFQVINGYSMVLCKRDSAALRVEDPRLDFNHSDGEFHIPNKPATLPHVLGVTLFGS